MKQTDRPLNTDDTSSFLHVDRGPVAFLVSRRVFIARILSSENDDNLLRKDMPVLANSSSTSQCHALNRLLSDSITTEDHQSITSDLSLQVSIPHRV
jgi:hypothetical protein